MYSLMLLQMMNDVKASRKLITAPLITTKYYSCCFILRGADLSALVKEAAITALKETLPMMSLLHQRNDNTSDPQAPINTNENTNDPQAPINTVVKHYHFISAFSKITPSVSKEVKVFPMLFLITYLSFSRIK